MICPECQYNNQFNEEANCEYCGKKIGEDKDFLKISSILKNEFEFESVVDPDGEIGYGRPSSWMCKPKVLLPYYKLRDLRVNHGIILLSAWTDYYIFIKDSEVRQFS